MLVSGLRLPGLNNHSLQRRVTSSILLTFLGRSRPSPPWHGLPPEIRSMIWEYATFSTTPIRLVESKDRIDYDEGSLYGNALVMQPKVRMDLTSFLLVAPSEHDMILDSFFSNIFEFQGCASSIHWFLDNRLTKASLLRISTLHLSEKTLLQGVPGNSDLQVRNLASFLEWSMNIHTLGLHVPGGDNGDRAIELWFNLVANAFYKRMILNVDILWPKMRNHNACVPPMLELYLSRYDLLNGGQIARQAILIWETDPGVLFPPINEVKRSLCYEYYQLHPFTAVPGRKAVGSHNSCSLLFRHKKSTQIERIIARMEAQLDSGNYDEEAEREAIHPITVPPLMERLRRAQKLLQNIESQSSYAAKQKEKLCEDVCSHVHRNVRLQAYHWGTSHFEEFKEVVRNSAVGQELRSEM